MGATRTDILLESGTNELEVIMFEIGSGVFGINVLKVREIINAVEVTKMPNQRIQNGINLLLQN